jgi:2-oxoglutarate dehydrogenase E1 component
MSRQDANAAFALSSFLQGTNATYIDEIYSRYENDPSSVDTEWREFFKSLKDTPADVRKNAEGPSWARNNWPLTPRDELTSALDGNWAEVEKAVGSKIVAKAQAKGAELTSADVHQATRDSVRALMLIRAYRMRGHFHAKLDPLGIEAPRDREELDPRSYGFTEADFDRKIFLDHVLGLEYGTLREIVAICERTYCQTLGVEFMHITNAAQKAWIQERIEGPDKEISFTREGRRAILNKLVEAEGFEKFCDLKFTGTKRFGLDGAESLIPALEQIIKRGGNLGVKEVVVGMPHRGRLNVLTQVMGKPHRALFHEFKGGSANPDAVEGSGDVKYHLGASSDREFDNNRIHLSLTANPSHLEIVDPVVLGKVRAKQDQHGDPPDQRISVLPLLMHGDAAFAGQGVVAECFRPEGLSHRRFAALHRQQPDRLHHLSALFALLALSVRRGEDDRCADLPCERRRSGSRGVRGQGRDRVPAEIPQARRHRHVLLSPPRPQRGRRAGVHPAGDVQEDRFASVHARDLRQAADRRGRDDRRRGGEGQGGLARAA